MLATTRAIEPLVSEQDMAVAHSLAIATAKQGTEDLFAHTIDGCDQMPSRHLLDPTRFLVMLERPAALEPQDGAQQRHANVRYAIAKRQRAAILAWIEDHGLSDQLTHIEVLPGGKLMRGEGTPALAKLLQRAPNILCIALVGDFEVAIVDEIIP
ncbi:hypothetical protein KFU94_42470 [Chloroflexi bacterium TSY]|nr:hypothetical protein [Chloroflexi bacterium TSY]